MRAGDLVVAGARGGAVGPVEARGTADGAVVALDAKDRRGDTEMRHSTTVIDGTVSVSQFHLVFNL